MIQLRPLDRDSTCAHTVAGTVGKNLNSSPIRNRINLSVHDVGISVSLSFTSPDLAIGGTASSVSAGAKSLNGCGMSSVLG
jgi:hypothetical protein